VWTRTGERVSTSWNETFRCRLSAPETKERNENADHDERCDKRRRQSKMPGQCLFLEVAFCVFHALLRALAPQAKALQSPFVEAFGDRLARVFRDLRPHGREHIATSAGLHQPAPGRKQPSM